MLQLKFMIFINKIGFLLYSSGHLQRNNGTLTTQQRDTYNATTGHLQRKKNRQLRRLNLLFIRN